jgi:hypothetical protein
VRDAVRQFVAVAGLAREMGGEQLARLADAVKEARRVFGFLEAAGHFGGQGLPEFVSATLVNGFVADDGELVRAWRDENEHRVAMEFNPSQPKQDEDSYEPLTSGKLLYTLGSTTIHG